MRASPTVIPLAALLDWADNVPWADILVPFGSALFGAGIGATGARHLRREELYVDAARQINEYMDEAVDTLNGIDRQASFDIYAVDRARRTVNLARFHSETLESDEVTNRLSVTGQVLMHIIGNETYDGLHFVYQSIDGVMAADIQFMKLPRFWPPWKRGRTFPKAWFPNTVEHYKELATWDDSLQKITWAKLREWNIERQREREQEEKLRKAA